MKSTKKLLLHSALALVLCVSMLIGSTFAWFTDSVASANNIIKSGNLDVELFYKNDTTSDWSKVGANTNVFKTATLWEPGHTEVVKLKTTNEGSLALKYQLGVNVVSEIGSINKNGEAFKLSEHLKFAVLDGEKNFSREQAITEAENTNATALNIAYKSDSLNLDAKNDGDTDEKIVTLVVYMPTTVGNEANHGKDQPVPTINLGINLVATQRVSESDSFGNDYDKDATYPAISQGKGDGVNDVALTAEDVTVTVPAAAGEGDFTLKVESKNVDTDNGGNTTATFEIKLLKDGVPVSTSTGIKYKAIIFVGTELQISAVKHNGVEIATGYTYDPATGMVEFLTDSFSPFAVIYKKIPADAVKVVDAANKAAYYNTLGEAAAAATSGSTIIVRSNTVLNETVVFQNDANVVLDLGGYTLSSDNLVTMLKLADGKTTIRNGVIRNVHEKAIETKFGIYMTGDAVAEIKDVKIETTGTGVRMDNNAHITELNANIESYITVSGNCDFNAIEMLDNAKIDLISGGTYKSYLAESMFEAKRSGQNTGHNSSWTIQLNSAGAYIGEISGGTFIGTMDTGNNGTPIHVNNGTVNEISGGYFGFTELSFQHPAYMLFTFTDNGGKINKITGGTFEEGCKPVNIPRYTSYGCDFLKIVDDSGCKVEYTGETVVRGAQWSSRVDSYDIKIVKVVAK